MKCNQKYLVEWADRWVSAAEAEIACLQKAISQLRNVPQDQNAKTELKQLQSIISQIRRAYERKKSMAAERWNITMRPMKH